MYLTLANSFRVHPFQGSPLPHHTGRGGRGCGGEGLTLQRPATPFKSGQRKKREVALNIRPVAPVSRDVPGIGLT